MKKIKTLIVVTVVGVLMVVVGVWLLLKPVKLNADEQMVETIMEAAELNSFFGPQNDWYAVEGAEEGNGMEPFVGYWGVVLHDGRAVINQFKGYVEWGASHAPIVAEHVPADNRALIVEDRDLPEEWRGSTILVLKESDDLPHLVCTSIAQRNAQGALEHIATMWLWDEFDKCYQPVKDSTNVSAWSSAPSEIM